MNRKQFSDWVLKDWWVKIICFVAAIMLAYFHHVQTIDSKKFVIPLNIHSEGVMTPVASSEILKNVKLVVRSENGELNSVTENDFNAFISITNEASSGRQTFPVIVQPSARLMLLDSLEIKVEPAFVSLDVQEKGFAYIPLEPTIMGEVAHGFSIESVELFPDNVKVNGPKDLVTSLTRIQTTRIQVDGLKESKTFEVYPDYTNKVMSTDKTVKILATVNVIESIQEKSFESIPVEIVNLHQDFEVSNGPFTVDVTIEGKLLTLENLSASKIICVLDVGEIQEEGDYQLNLKVNAPNGAKVLRTSADNISVKVVKRKVQKHKPNEEGEEEN